MMTAAEMADVHAAAFTTPRPWSEAEIADLLASPLCFALTEPGGFLLGRVVAGEAELLTIAVAPDARRRGLGFLRRHACGAPNRRFSRSRQATWRRARFTRRSVSPLRENAAATISIQMSPPMTR